MRKRLVLSAAIFSAVAMAVPAALASSSTPVLDGKKVTKLTLSASGGLQSNDKDQASLTTTDRADCTAPRCAALPFVYQPAKGVSGDTAYAISWTNPASDFDLYVAEVSKSGSRTTVAKCGGGAGTSEKVFVPAGTLKAGKTYALVVDFYRSVNDTVNGTVEMPGTNGVKSTVPSAVETQTQQAVNCTL
jgi:hypothetical protein